MAVNLSSSFARFTWRIEKAIAASDNRSPSRNVPSRLEIDRCQQLPGRMHAVDVAAVVAPPARCSPVDWRYRLRCVLTWLPAPPSGRRAGGR